MKRIIITTFTILLILAIQGTASNIYMVNKTHTDGMVVMGQQQPAEDEIQKVWLTDDKIKEETESETILIFLKEKRMLIFNHEEKTYTEIPLGSSDMMDKALEGKSEEERQKMEGFMQMAQGMMKFEVKVTPTSETKKIKDWNCKKYNEEINMGMGVINSEVWATEDLEMDYELMRKYMTSMMATIPGFSNSFDKAMEEFKKIKGVPVLTKSTMNMMGMKTNSTDELVEFKNQTFPKGTFDIPKGYEKTEAEFGH